MPTSPHPTNEPATAADTTAAMLDRATALLAGSVALLSGGLPGVTPPRSPGSGR